MEAKAGDVLVVEGKKVGQARREGEILEVIARSGSTNYRVRWSDGHESVFSPSADARVLSRAGLPEPGGPRAGDRHG